jgi:hypothetical protein
MSILAEAARLVGPHRHMAVSNPEWRALLSDIVAIYRWRPVSERPEDKGRYQVVKKMHDGTVTMGQRYWTGHGWDTREQVLYWRPLDFPDGVRP